MFAARTALPVRSYPLVDLQLDAGWVVRWFTDLRAAAEEGAFLGPGFRAQVEPSDRGWDLNLRFDEVVFAAAEPSVQERHQLGFHQLAHGEHWTVRVTLRNDRASEIATDLEPLCFRKLAQLSDRSAVLVEALRGTPHWLGPPVDRTRPEFSGRTRGLANRHRWAREHPDCRAERNAHPPDCTLDPLGSEYRHRTAAHLVASLRESPLELRGRVLFVGAGDFENLRAVSTAYPATRCVGLEPLVSHCVAAVSSGLDPTQVVCDFAQLVPSVLDGAFDGLVALSINLSSEHRSYFDALRRLVSPSGWVLAGRARSDTRRLADGGALVGHLDACFDSVQNLSAGEVPQRWYVARGPRANALAEWPLAVELDARNRSAWRRKRAYQHARQRMSAAGLAAMIHT